MTSPSENTKDILVIYEEEAKEWALYLESLFKHIIKEEAILLYNLDTSSIQHLESFSLSCYRCKLLILTNGLLRCLNQKRSYFLHRVLEPPGKVVILLCGVENSHILYEMLTLDQSSQEISTDLEPEEYLSIVAGIIQQDERQKEEAEESLSYIYETVLADDYQAKSEVNLQLDRGVSVKTDVSLKTEEVSETLETTRPSVLVLPTRISCENPGEIFILLRDEITETVEIEFITDNQRIRTQPAFWNQKVRFMKAVDFPAGHVNVNVYCGGVIKAVTQIEYYTAVEEIERIFKEVADPIAFACQAFKFTSVEKLDSTLTFLLKSKLSVSEFGAFPNEEHHQQANSHLEELPTLLHCAAKFGLKNLANLLLQCPEASQACRIANKHGENPARIAGKHGHKELQIIIQELSVHAVDSEDGRQEQEEEEVEDGIYVAMLSSDPHVTSSLTDKQSPGDQCRDRQKAWEESGKKEEDDEEEEKEEAEEDMGMEEKEDEENNLEESSYTSGDSNDNLYASIPDYDPEADGRDFLFSDKPPLPPREPPITIKHNDLYCLSQAGKLVEERNKKDETSCHLEAYGGAEDKSEEEEEDPYTFADEDESVYDMILASDVEKRKERGSLIINRPPAPAPRPLSSPVKEENTPYIVQGLDDVFRQIASSTTCSVFQQKATRIHSDNEKMYSAVRKQDRVPTETSAYATVRHSIPSGQEELILLQEQVKKGTITVDEALEKFKQWQTEKSRLEVTQKEKVRQLRNTIIGNRPEEEILYDKITIEHHPHVSKESRRESLPFKDMMYDTTFNKLAPPRNPSEKEQMPKNN